jgi:hypothetical protein
MFEFLRKLFGYGPVEAPPKPINWEGPPRESYSVIPFEHTEALPDEEFLSGTMYDPQANTVNTSGGYYANLRAKLEEEEAYHFQLLDASVDFITRLNAWNLRKSNRTTAEIDEDRAVRVFGDPDHGGYAGTISQKQLEKATARFEAGDVNLKDDRDNG